MDYISESMGHASSDHAITQIYIEHYPLDIQMQNNSKLLNLGNTSERDALLAKLVSMSTEELLKLFRHCLLYTSHISINKLKILVFRILEDG